MVTTLDPTDPDGDGGTLFVLVLLGDSVFAIGEFVPVYAPDPALGEGDVDVFDSGEAPPPAFGEGNS